MRAPIALFVYRRPHHLETVLKALSANPEARDSLLYIFSDAPRDESATRDVQHVRDMVHAVRGFGEVRAVYRDRNLGLARSIIDGASHILSQHDSVVVLEDDLVASPHMLRFFGDALTLYRDEPRVACITAYCYPVDSPLPDTYLLRGADCSWGWATWRDQWRHFNPNGAQLLDQMRSAGLCRAFDLDGATAFTDMLEDQIAGRNDSWAIRWHASCFLRNSLTLHPGRSLVRNIGFDGVNATHCRKTTRYDVDLDMRPVPVSSIEIADNSQARAIYREFHRRSRPPFFHARRLLHRLRHSIAPAATAAAR